MNSPKLHHYVPQFYLRRFVDDSGRLWVLDRDNDRKFAVKPSSVATENNFYFSDELAELGEDALTMEKQFSELEGEVALITSQWLDWLREVGPGERIPIPDVNRELLSRHIALQFLRTAGTRDILAIFGENTEGRELSPEQRRNLHMYMLWSSKLVHELEERIRASTWIFGKNDTEVPFVTSDNPVAFRTGDNSMWWRNGLWTSGTYAVFPLAPDIVMYCHPAEPPWLAITELNECLSPVRFTQEMVASENSGQVFMAPRFVFSRRANFDAERKFAKTIGTDLYVRERHHEK